MIELLLNNNELVLDDAESLSYFISPLFVATMYGRDDALRLLLRKGLPPNQNFKSTEWTSLMISALTGTNNRCHKYIYFTFYITLYVICRAQKFY